MRSRAPLLLLIAGLTLIILAILPTLVFALEYFINPQTELLDPSAVSLSLKRLTSASDWFTAASQLPQAVSTTQTHFSLIYPRLGLDSISVAINSDDLKKGAIHYSGTALPGQYGNAVIFGHSALPVLFKKNAPLTIFNPILKAKIGDEIILNFDGINYRYLVRKVSEVKPDQIEVLFQNFSRKELTLITCTPLGTYWRRFVVRAELVN
jgi:sortase A